MTTAPNPLDVALLVTRVFDTLGVLHTIGGSIASSIAGEPRSTVDIDIVAAVTPAHVSAIVTALSGDFYVDEAALRRAIAARGTVNLIHQASQLKVDVFIAGGTPLDGQQLARRRRVEIGSHVIHVHPPEDILLQKLRWYRLGGDVSDRQWRDVLAIARAQGSRLDRAYLEANAPVLGVTDLLTRLFAES